MFENKVQVRNDNVVSCEEHGPWSQMLNMGSSQDTSSPGLSLLMCKRDQNYCYMESLQWQRRFTGKGPGVASEEMLNKK
jgi:hypothetical protein